MTSNVTAESNVPIDEVETLVVRSSEFGDSGRLDVFTERFVCNEPGSSGLGSETDKDWKA